MLKHFHWVFFIPLHFQMCEGRGACVHGSPCVCCSSSSDLTSRCRDCCRVAVKFHAAWTPLKSVFGSVAFFLPLEVRQRHNCFTQVTRFTGCDRATARASVRGRTRRKAGHVCVLRLRERERERVCALHPPKANYVSQAPLNSSNILFLCITKRPIRRHESNPSVNVH